MKRLLGSSKWPIAAGMGLAVGIGALIWGCAATQRPDGGVGLLPVGARAPDVSGVDQAGKPHRLSESLGSPTLVYFYPADGTPGCTKEACAFRDVWKRYESANVRLFGVSTDSADSHRGFAQEHSLSFPLIADPDHLWGTAFGVSTFLGMYERVSFLVGPDGKVAKVYPDVDPGLHATEVLEDARALPAPTPSPRASD
jgi:peroxiredoxin Q/BCP